MILNIDLTEEDSSSLVTHLLRTNYKNVLTKSIFRWLFLIFVSTALYYLVLTSLGAKSWQLFTGLFILLLVFSSPFIFQSIYDQIEIEYRTNKEDKRMRLLIDKTGLEIKYKDSNLQVALPWKLITDLVEKDDYYFIYSNLGIIIIPKRCFENSKEESDFISKIKDKISISKSSNIE